MHELSLAVEILRLVQDAAARERFQRVAMLRLEAGALAGIEVGALRFALSAVSPGTCLDGANIDIEQPPGRAWCGHCATEVAIHSRADPCPSCGSVALRPTGGDALRVLDLLVQPD